MKIRYLLAGYTVMMILLLLFLVSSFSKEAFVNRDMVYYNEQQILVENAIAEGLERDEIEQTYGCEIIYIAEAGYEISLQEALKEEALILDYFQDDTLVGKFIWNEEERHYQILQDKLYQQTILIWCVVFLGGCLLLGFIYLRMIRPFHNLQIFSRQVAKGNLDFPLNAKKHDYFGAFTESFDLMREELKRARESEYQANKSKKELMAELSHDIKTPIATIQATCEVLQIKEKNIDTLEKVTLIDGKAKMIHNLVDNLFHATLEELTVLKVEPVEESSLCLAEMFSEANYYGEMTVTGSIPECLLYMDKLRLQQVIDNCLNNSWKYAGTPIQVSFQELPNGIQIKIKDEGEGVAEDELPLIMEKFYRGSNAKGKAGSGLGLYLAKTFMEQMQGDMDYYNEKGFVVQLFLRKV